MAEHRCRQRRPVLAEMPAPRQNTAPMEAADEPMNRYISATTLSSCAVTRSCEDACCSQQNRILLEQLVELSAQQNQILLDLLGAVNSLTAALLTARAQI